MYIVAVVRNGISSTIPDLFQNWVTIPRNYKDYLRDFSPIQLVGNHLNSLIVHVFIISGRISGDSKATNEASIKECGVCYEEEYDRHPLPCCNGYLCVDCARRVSKCPFCRSTVSMDSTATTVDLVDYSLDFDPNDFITGSPRQDVILPNFFNPSDTQQFDPDDFTTGSPRQDAILLSLFNQSDTHQFDPDDFDYSNFFEWSNNC